MATGLNDLSVELLLQIFQYCDIKELCKLKATCRRFRKIIKTYKIVSQDQHTLATNQIQNSMKARSCSLLNPFDKWRVSYNWKIGRYKTLKLLRQKRKQMPWLSLDKQFVWISSGHFVKAFKRIFASSLIIENEPTFTVTNETTNDIVRFRKKNNLIISGLREGGMWIWSLDEKKFIRNHANIHSADVLDVDLTKDICVSSASDGNFSIWPLHLENNGSLEPVHTELINDRIWSIGISPCSKYLGVGTAGYNDVPPFHVFDLESTIPIIPTHRQPSVKGAGVLGIHWENENSVLTCGYDTYLKKWDLRTGQVVQSWEDPHDSALCCLASDDQYTVLTGSMFYGKVVLWDQRVPVKYIQLYFTGSTSTCLYKSSPVYSVGFDSTQLFSALDQNMTCLDFFSSYGKIRNYQAKYYTQSRT